jgi:hypothetical protein
VNNELNRMWRYELQFQHSIGCTEENNKTGNYTESSQCPGKDLNQVSPKYKSEVIPVSSCLCLCVKLLTPECCMKWHSYHEPVFCGVIELWYGVHAFTSVSSS